MEKDDEVKGGGNSYDFGARMYDSRVGRWWSRDALETNYSHLSTYSFSGNNPILWKDSDGNIIRDPKGNIVYVKIGEIAYKGTTLEVMVIFGNDNTPILAYRNKDNVKFPGLKTDCHGQTFTKGEFWIDNEQIPVLIKADGLVEVPYETRTIGDAAVFTTDGVSVEDSRTIT